MCQMNYFSNSYDKYIEKGCLGFPCDLHLHLASTSRNVSLHLVGIKVKRHAANTYDVETNTVG